MSKTEQIIECFFNSEQPEDMQEAFFLWLIHPDSAGEKDQAMFAQWEEYQEIEDSSTEKSYQQVASRLGFCEQPVVRSLSFRMARIAALFVIPLLSATTAYWYVQTQQPEELTWVECFVQNGDIREIVLPDRSKVTVNSGSTLIYPEDFKGNNRSIYLSGEAKFVVAKDPCKPFIVKTKDMNVNALGTTFHVSSYADNPQTVATLVQGAIQVDIITNGKSIELYPNEQLVYDKQTQAATRKAARIDYVLAWERGQMVFQSASLQTIVKAIERHYQVTVYLNSTGLKDEKLTVKFLHDETLEETLYTLKQIIKGFHYKTDKDKIYIY
ncbi:MAG: FecR domain-containing protein [Tannerella sp.]|jgi:ferric-dicitrate binding protein FerR (iron transport regulator)|nr:FecR domain-containing protein [Tannerella sp.]